MNLGLSLLAQIKDGFARKTIQDFISSVNTGYHKQHNVDDTHGTITASGAISERKRAVAMGVWTPVAFNAANFTASGTTWTVTSSEQRTLKYMLVGTTLWVTFYITTSAVGALSSNLFIALPLNASATVQAYSTCNYNDNGTYGTGTIFIPTGTTSPKLQLMKNIDASVQWSSSSALTISGQVAFEVTGSI